RRFFPKAAGVEPIDSMVIMAKRATFRGCPGQHGMRPSCPTPIENLFLAGDWTDTGLPSTIESAVDSGFTAADHIARA
ncbi:MAG: hypothetical protein GXP54_08455, partial [Deltaproteobacteria bacterium]|nr:hypothetical protein [Deltaproteobacteria bacterium]